MEQLSGATLPALRKRTKINIAGWIDRHVIPSNAERDSTRSDLLKPISAMFDTPPTGSAIPFIQPEP
jgi:hypothetical protein